MNEELNLEPEGLGRCGYEFQMGEMKGKRCGLARDPEDEEGYCFWHSRRKNKFNFGTVRQVVKCAQKERAQEMRKLVQAGACLEGVVLGGAQLQRMWLYRCRLGDHVTVVFDGHEPPGGLGTTIAEGANLQRSDMSVANLRGAYMIGAQLQGANLFGAQLQGVGLPLASLDGADLTLASLHGADLRCARLYDSRILSAGISMTTRFEGAHWDKRCYLLEEREVDGGAGQGHTYQNLQGRYRRLRDNHRHWGDYEVATQFFYREMECRRKGAERLGERVWLTIYKVLCGYGERPLWAFVWVAGFNILPVLAFLVLGGQGDYGEFRPVSAWGHVSAILQPLINTFLIALFVVCFVRKAMRG